MACIEATLLGVEQGEESSGMVEGGSERCVQRCDFGTASRQN